MPNYSSRLERWAEEVWNNKNESAIDELLDQEGEIHGLETEMTGPADFKPFYHGFLEAFPSVHLKTEVLVANDEFEAAHCTVTAQSADGKDVSFSGIVIGRFKDGKIVEGWNAFDFLTMYKQLGQKLVAEEEAVAQ
jgi:predicted ester cyclase